MPHSPDLANHSSSAVGTCSLSSVYSTIGSPHIAENFHPSSSPVTQELPTAMH